MTCPLGCAKDGRRSVMKMRGMMGTGDVDRILGVDVSASVGSSGFGGVGHCG
jgi:hypothetical protein